MSTLFIAFVGDTVADTITWVLFALSLSTVVYGMISWCIIKKFRHYRNYVIFNVIFMKMLSLLITQIQHLVQTSYAVLCVGVCSDVLILVIAFLCMFSILSCHCWLLVMCYMFYVDFVKVFNFDFRKKFLKSSLFGWVLPFVTITLYSIVSLSLYVYASINIVTDAIIATIVLTPLVFNFIIYVTVVYALFFRSEFSSISSTNKLRRFYAGTLVFVFSNILVLTILFEIFEISNLIIAVIAELGEHLATIALNVYMILVKSNRKIWHHFLKTRNINRNNLEMQ